MRVDREARARRAAPGGLRCSSRSFRGFDRMVLNWFRGKIFAFQRFPLAPDGEFWLFNTATRWTGYSGGYAWSDANNAHNAFESVEQFIQQTVFGPQHGQAGQLLLSGAGGAGG